MGDPEKLLGDPKSFSLSCSKRALTSTSVRYWGLAPPPTANPPSGWALSWLTTRGALCLISWVLSSLRRRISCCKSFSISTIQAIRSSFCPMPLCLETASCSTRATLFLCLEVTSFSPTGSNAASGTLVPLLFLGLGAVLCERTASSLSFT